jgi:ABC-2 type transport system permease protein
VEFPVANVPGSPALSVEMSSTNLLRYPRLFASFARYCLIRELGFRVNFLVRCLTNVVWLLMLLLFFQLIYGNTERIGDWDRWQYLFFMGVGVLLNGILETFFVENCNNLSELIRTGDLDFALVKPIDEQFLLTFQRVDWAESFNIFVGIGLLGVGLVFTGTPLTPALLFGFAALMAAGAAIMYSLLLLVAASSVWMIRNQSLYEMWWYVTQFARYPSEIYSKENLVGVGLKFALTFVLPVLLAVNMPARYGMPGKTIDPFLIFYLFLSAVAALVASRWFFRRALRAYRGASS